MSLPVLPADQFRSLILQKIPVIDVRAPVEFEAGSIPGSVNLPILTNEERHEIGTIYKKLGNAAAVARGHELVSGPVKDSRVALWKQTVEKDPRTILTCFRGGQRSQITQKWLMETGIERPRIEGGYKAFRQFLIEETSRLSARTMCVISGATGSGKTLVIREIIKERPTVDLEAYANHRGSAFGGYAEGQPSQAEFENRLAAGLMHLEATGDSRDLVVEDESRLIGRCAQPEIFFHSLRASGVVMVDEPLHSRAKTTFDDYILASPIGSGSEEAILQTYLRYKKSLQSIVRKLGGLKFSEIEKDLLAAEQAALRGDLEPNLVWISKLLEFYYDPLYFGSLERRNPKILFRGLRREVIDWLKS